MRFVNIRTHILHLRISGKTGGILQKKFKRFGTYFSCRKKGGEMMQNRAVTELLFTVDILSTDRRVGLKECRWTDNRRDDIL